MKKGFLCLSILFIIISFTTAQPGSNKNITCKQAMELIQKHNQDADFIILDVRTPEEFKIEHIENAILIDYRSGDFKDKINQLDKKKTYLVYCRGGGRSAGAIEIMKDLDFISLYHLYEGMEIWKNEGYKTVPE